MREKRGKIVGKALIYSYLRGKKRKKKRAKKSLFVSIVGVVWGVVTLYRKSLDL